MKKICLYEIFFLSLSIEIKIKNHQRQYSDKKVYDNINQILRKLANEKN